MIPYLSEKFKILSLFSIVLVIYIHMYYTEGESYKTLSFIEGLIGGSIGKIAVPLFYFISGYLFFLKAEKGITAILAKMRKRIKTLLVPYLLANTLTFIFYVILNILTQIIPPLDKVVNFKVLSWMHLNIVEILHHIYCGPIAFQLWFVRDLILIVIISPLIFLWLKKILAINSSAWWTIIIAWVPFVCLFLIGYISLFWGLLWVSAGGIFAISKKISLTTSNISTIKALLLILTTLSLCLMNALHILPTYLSSCIPFIGVPAIWILYDKFSKGIHLSNLLISEMCSYTFFIYLIHEPILNIFKKLPLLISRSELCMIISYLIIPLIFCICAIYLGRLLKSKMPKFYHVYTGGR